MHPGTTASQYTWPGHRARGAVIGTRFAQGVDNGAGFDRAGGSGACATTLGSAWRFSHRMRVGRMRCDAFLAIAAPREPLGGLEICPDIDIENGKIWSDMERAHHTWKVGLRPTSRLACPIEFPTTTTQRAKLNTPELESIVDIYPGVRLKKSKTQYEALYETPDGKHLAIERRSKSQFKLFLESSFDPSSITLSNSAVVEHLSRETKRIHLSSKRLAGPYNGTEGNEAWLLRLSSERDLRDVLQSYLGIAQTKTNALKESEIQPVEPIQDEDDESAFAEGAAKYELHRNLERDRTLANRAKKARLEKTGTLQCDVCDFNFEKVFGSLGVGFIEAHHTNPVSGMDGATKTRLDSLAMVCSNCHRMLHRSNPMLTPADLREQIRAWQA